jgi:hypothetical protein
MALTQPQRDLLEELESMPASDLTADNRRLLVSLQQKRGEGRHLSESKGEGHGSLRSIIEVGEGKRGTPDPKAPTLSPAAPTGCPTCQAEGVRVSSLIDFVLHECPSCKYSWKTPATGRVANPSRSPTAAWPPNRFVASPKRFRTKGKPRRSDD